MNHTSYQLPVSNVGTKAKVMEEGLNIARVNPGISVTKQLNAYLACGALTIKENDA